MDRDAALAEAHFTGPAAGLGCVQAGQAGALNGFAVI